MKNRKKLFTAFLFILCYCSNYAQTIAVSGRCITGTVTLSLSAGLDDGKVWYEGSGTVNGIGSVVAIWWNNTEQKWYLGFDGQPHFANTNNTTLPPSTTSGTWAAIDVNGSGGTADDCPATNGALSMSGTGTGTLPVELISFTANTEGGKTQLNWTTASEKNNLGFDIERSKDGAKFAKIGFVKGNGTSVLTHQYSFIDAISSSGITYYRLKQVDIDGTYAYSKIISIASEKSGSKIKIYPTNTEGVVWIDDAGLGVEKVSVFNAVGQLILTFKNVKQIDLSALQSGMYIVQAQAGSEKVAEKVFKQ
jgi:hypothetical protein